VPDTSEKVVESDLNGTYEGWHRKGSTVSTHTKINSKIPVSVI